MVLNGSVLRRVEARRATLACTLLLTGSLSTRASAHGGIDLISRSVSPPSTGGGETVLNQDPAGLPCCATSQDGRFVVFVSDAANLVPGQLDTNQATDVFLRDLALGTTTVVSHAAGSPLQAGNGASSYPTVSADGHYVAFESVATDLVPLAIDSPLARKVFVFDRSTGGLDLVSHVFGSSSQAAPESYAPVLSADGRFVAFLSWADNLVAGQADTNGRQDAFLFDRLALTTTLVSHAVGLPLTAADQGSSGPLAVSTDGSTVAFLSAGRDLVAGQTGTTGNLFLFDRTTGQNLLASHAAGVPNQGLGAQTPTMSADGRFAFFWTANPPGPATTGFYRFDRSTGVNTLVSGSGRIASSADGRWVASDGEDVYLRDFGGGTSILVSHVAGSISPASTIPGVSSKLRAVSADGRWVLYWSNATNLVAGQVGGGPLFLYDRLSNESVLVTHRPGLPLLGLGDQSGQIDRAVLSNDGGVVFFDGGESRIAAQDTNHHRDVFAYRRNTGDLSAASLRAPAMASATANRESVLTSPYLSDCLSANGGYVLFSSNATDLLPGQVDDGIGVPTIPSGYPRGFYLRDRGAGTSQLVNHTVADPRQLAREDPFLPSARLSADGRFVAFTSSATDLVAGFTGSSAGDVYLFDRVTGANTQVSRSTAGPGTGGESSEPASSEDGRYVAFTSRGTSLVAGQVDANGLGGTDVFLYDRVAAATTLISHRANEPTTTGNDAAGAPSISADGRQVAYFSSATDVVPGQTGPTKNFFVFDRQTGASRLVSHVAGDALAAFGQGAGWPFVSADGAYVAYISSGSDVAPGVQGYLGVYLYDMASGTNIRVSSSTGVGDAGSALPSADGRFVAYATAAQLEIPGSAKRNSGTDVFLFDRVTGERVLVSHLPGSALATGNGPSALKSMSADGRYVLFSSSATDILPGAPGDFIFDRVTGRNTSVSQLIGVPPTSLGAALSSDGAHLAFQGAASTIVPADFNGWSDVFASDIAQAVDLAVTKTGPTSAQPGESIIFSVAATNIGTLPAETVVLDDSGPAGLIPGPVTGACASFPCSLGTLGVGVTRQVDVSYTIPTSYSSPAPIVNVATASTTSPELDTANNIAYAQVALPSAFYTLAPCRLADTREAGGPFGGPALPAGGSRNFTVTGSCGIPDGAKSLALNVTVVGPTEGGFVRLSPVATIASQTSTINFGVGQTRANNAVVPVGIGGQIAAALGMAAGQAHLILDVVGYFK
jgi:uncharacterized repeat protein (TIGR01451 family)